MTVEDTGRAPLATVWVHRACDTVFTVDRFDLLPNGDDGDPMPFGEDETVFLNVCLDPAVQFEGVIDGASVTFTVPHGVSDQIRNRTLFQVVLNDGTREPQVVGCFHRWDGKEACE